MAPIVRILLRVAAGILIGWGFPADSAEMLWTDPEIVTAIAGFLTLALTEGWYWLAKRNGWNT